MAKDKKPQQPLTARLGMAGGLIGALLGSMVVGPQMYPRAPGQGFNVEQMICAGVCGALGAVVGWLIGRLIEGPPRERLTSTQGARSGTLG